MKVNCKLRELMEKRDITQLELASKTGLAPSTVGRLYRNQISRIDCDTVIALVKYFNLKSIAEIFEVG
jgi:transcriptional regulator with XRE-family HTH domain